MKALIFAAGLGTRLKPITDSVPKALVEVGGRPLLRIVTDKLRRSGITDICVNVHHHSDVMKKYLESHDTGLEISDESDLLRDTGGGIRHAATLIKGSGPFLVHNVDILTDADISALVSAHRPEALATLLVSDRVTSRYLLFDNDMRLRGWKNVKTGEIRSPFSDFDPSDCRMLAFGGIHVISEEVFDIMEDWPESFSIIDFYLNVADKHPVFGVEPQSLQFLDVGKIETLQTANILCERGERFWE